MIQTYKIDKVVCLKHITVEQGSSISYRARTGEARAAQAKYRQKCRLVHSDPDKNCEFGPPDKTTNFEVTTSCKRPSASTSKSCSLPSSKKRCTQKNVSKSRKRCQAQRRVALR